MDCGSWGSGANPWGPEREDTFSKPTHYDGMLEIVGVTGVVHMGQIQSGLRTGVRIAQGGHVSLCVSVCCLGTWGRECGGACVGVGGVACVDYDSPSDQVTWVCSSVGVCGCVCVGVCECVSVDCYVSC